MHDWTSGYVADIGYTFGYYFELNPLSMRLAFLYDGLLLPEIENACELGFGQGLSANFHAAGSATNWHGTDFNPAQAAFARELTREAGTSTQLFDESFAEYCARTDLPDFDFIGLHGIWSWISDDNRKILVDFVRRKLRVGGVLYTSYNTLPGWSTFASMRHLLTQHADIIGAEGSGIVSRIDGALDFAIKFLATRPAYLNTNPVVETRLRKLLEQNRHYLAHEYFNKDWHPMHFASMVEWLKPAKVEYACSAVKLEHLDRVNLSEAQQKFLLDIPDALMRQSVRDFMVNQQFRKDYWVRGSRKLSALERHEALLAERIVLASYREEIPLTVQVPTGEATLNPDVYNPILDALADYKVTTIGELYTKVKDKKIELGQLHEAVMVLADGSRLLSAQDEKVIGRRKKYTDRLNCHLQKKARSGHEIAYLVSPVTGGGIGIGRINQLFAEAAAAGRKQPAEWAQYVWSLLESQGQRLKTDGKIIESKEDNLIELTKQAKEFAHKRLPILRALQIA